MKLYRRIHYLLSRRALERDLQDEMSAHREMLAADRKTSFGSDLRLREQSRDAWGFVWLDQLLQDLAYGARQLRRSPGFTLAAVGILALGVGLNLAAFHLYNAAVWNRISVRDAPSLYQFVRQQTKERGPARFPFAAIRFYADHSTNLAYVLAENTSAELSVDNDPQPVRSNFVSGNYFRDLDITPSSGRLLDQRDSDPGAPLVAVLGYAYWQLHFGGDSGFINGDLHVIHINGQPVQVVGVAPASFDGLLPRQTAIWLPTTTYPALTPAGPSANDFSRPDSNMFVKLKPGVSLPTAEAELRALTSELAREQPKFIQSGETIHGQLLSKSRSKLGPLPLIVPLVLLILFAACANLATVLLARGLVREQEIQTRAALGAGRSRIIRQLMTENLLLAILGSAASLVVGAAGAKLLLFLTDAPPDLKVVTDWKIWLAGATLTILSVLGFGLAPAIQAVRGALQARRSRQILLAVQVAVSCILLILSSVLAKSGWRLANLNLRFDAAHVAVIQAYPANVTATSGQILDSIAARIREAPGVDGVTFARNAPLHDWRIGHPSGMPETIWNDVESGYFQVMNLPVLRGRTFLRGEQNAVVLSESAARAVWPTDDPLGKTWPSDLGPRNIVGVVKDSGAGAMVLGMGADSEAVEAYLPLNDRNAAGIKLLVHTSSDPAALLRYARSADSATGTYVDAWLVQSDLNKRIAESRMVIQLVGATGVLATLLAAMGIFGLLAFAVAQRTREIGVRVALGAAWLQIVRTLLDHCAIPLGVGGLAGLVLAAAGEQILRNQFFGLPELDLLGYAAGLSGFGIVAIVAVLIPVRRALRIDPASALRWE